MASKKDPTELLDALVAHATRHGGSESTAILDAQARYHGEPTAAEATAAATAADEAEQEAGKAANAAQVEAETKAAADSTEGNGEDE